MEIKELKINNFRGIKSLDWKINSRIVCLIGPGDSTKSTVLSSIALLFSPRWNVQISDLDFFKLDVSEIIEISAVITGFPKEFSQDNKFGLFHCFWNKEESVHVLEKPGDQPALEITFRVDKTLEPNWVVRNLDSGEEKPITAGEREKLFVAELGMYISRDLSWGRFSGLTKLTGSKNTRSSSVALAEITRLARDSFSPSDFNDLENALDELKEVVINFGVEPKGELTPGLDPRELSIGAGLITVRAGGIPLNVHGLGTKRLFTMAIYHAIAEEGAVFLLDEVETGFEPFRLRKLLNNLKNSPTSQSFITTHSVTPILELADDGIFIVRNNAGCTTINPLAKELVPFARTMPEALLSKVIIVCEGKTEWGILRPINDYWSKSKKELDFGTSGVEPAFHNKYGGSNSHQQAELLSQAGFVTAFFGDSDRDTNPTFEELEELGVGVFTWPGGICTEQRICLDVPYEGLHEMVNLAVECGTHLRDIYSNIKPKLIKHEIHIDNFEELWTIGNELVIRETLGDAFKSLNCFKKDDRSLQLGNLLVDYLDYMVDTPTRGTLDELIMWCHEQSS